MRKLVIDYDNYKKTKAKKSYINIEKLIKEKRILLVKNYDNLDSDKFIKIIVDKKIENNYETTFKDFFYKSAITELENKYYKDKSCIDFRPIYDNLETHIINKNGLIFRCKILKKGTVLYKAQKGFVLPKDELNHLKTLDSKNLLYFSDIFYPYNIVRTNFFGLCSYIVKKDFILFDRCDMRKGDGIFKLNSNKREKKDIKRLSFFGDLDNLIYEYLKNIKHIGKEWNEIWIYTGVLNNIEYGLKCSEESKFNKKKLSSVVINNTMSAQNNIFSMLKKKIHIEGFINCSRFSPIDKNGYFPEDEIAIPISEILNKNIVRNTGDPLDWTNWKLKRIKLPTKSIFFSGGRISFNIQTNPINKPKNDKFALIKYLEDSNNKFKKIEEMNMFLTYNVHFFENMDTFSKNIPNKDICSFINHYYKKLDICVLQEFKSDKYFEQNIKFKHAIYTDNGTSGSRLKLCVLSKKKLKYEIVYYKDMRKINRNSIIIDYNGNKVACVHITISFRNQITKNEKNYFKDISDQLEGIFEKEPDYIIGDFNFSPEDKREIEFMKSKNYTLLIIPKKNTTPYNKVDLVFKKKYKKSDNFSDIFLTDFSDHRPVFYKFII